MPGPQQPAALAARSSRTARCPAPPLSVGAPAGHTPEGISLTEQFPRRRPLCCLGTGENLSKGVLLSVLPPARWGLLQADPAHPLYAWGGGCGFFSCRTGVYTQRCPEGSGKEHLAAEVLPSFFFPSHHTGSGHPSCHGRQAGGGTKGKITGQGLAWGCRWLRSPSHFAGRSSRELGVDEASQFLSPLAVM